MARDMHVHYEIKINGNWEHYMFKKFPRLYYVFYKIAIFQDSNDKDKRECITSCNRGIPSDATRLTQFNYKRKFVDLHTPSYLNATEMMQLFRFIEQTMFTSAGTSRQYANMMSNEIGYLFGCGWDSYFDYRDEFPKELEDIRMIFWFDN